MHPSVQNVLLNRLKRLGCIHKTGLLHNYHWARIRYAFSNVNQNNANVRLSWKKSIIGSVEAETWVKPCEMGDIEGVFRLFRNYSSWKVV